MNSAELILKIAYSSAITLASILKTRSARRLDRCLLPAFFCAHIFIERETSGYEAAKVSYVHCGRQDPATFLIQIKLFFRNWCYNLSKTDPMADNFDSRLTQEFLASQDGISKTANDLRQELQRWKEVVVKIGITGASGTGKSSFINSIRGYVSMQ